MRANHPTYYEILGLAQTATQAEIKKRYRELARRHHPDVAEAPDAAVRFREINEANRILSDPARRATYDAELKLKARPQPRTADGGRPTTDGVRRPPPSTTSTTSTGSTRPERPTPKNPAAQSP